jgi:hypothetical protein
VVNLNIRVKVTITFRQVLAMAQLVLAAVMYFAG